jgi:DNA replicative helicase MCM subunit Mcm2 (Cdc46/Mcm family)
MMIDTTNGAAGSGENQDGVHVKEFMRNRVEEFMSKQESKKNIRGLLQKEQSRLGVSMDELRKFDPALAKYVQKNPIDAVNLFEGALDRSIKDMQDDSKGGNPEKQQTGQNDKAFPTKTRRYYVNFEGNFGRNLVTPRGLKANLINQLVSVRGIVTKVGLVKPMI